MIETTSGRGFFKEMLFCVNVGKENGGFDFQHHVCDVFVCFCLSVYVLIATEISGRPQWRRRKVHIYAENLYSSNLMKEKNLKNLNKTKNGCSTDKCYTVARLQEPPFLNFLNDLINCQHQITGCVLCGPVRADCF